MALSDSVKWSLGVVVIPIGLSLAASGLAIASFQGEQVAKNEASEKEIGLLRTEMRADLSSLIIALKEIAATQNTISKKQVELSTTLVIREGARVQFYSEFRDMRTMVIQLNTKVEGLVK